jgi:hypothetical protein
MSALGYGEAEALAIIQHEADGVRQAREAAGEGDAAAFRP